MKEGAVTLSSDGTIYYCNRGFADMLKTPLEKMIGTGVSQFVSPSDREKFEELLSLGRGNKGEVTFVAGNQATIPSLVSVNTMQLEGLSAVYLIVTDITELKRAEKALQKARDELEIRVEERTKELAAANEELKVEIDERRQTEEALRESEERFHLLYDLTMEGIVIHDKGIIVESNDSLARMFGYGSASEMVGMSGSDLMTPETQRLFMEHINKESEEPYQGTGIKKDGTLFPIEIHARNIVHMGKKIRAGTVYDLTERKRAEEALRDSEGQFRRAIEEAPIPVIMHAEDGEVLQISRTWTELTGYTLQDVPTLDAWLNNAYGEGADIVRDHMHKLFKGSQHSIDIEFPIHTRNRKILHWSFSASSPGKLQDGRRFIVGMAVDITERKQAEEALQKAHDELELRVQERTEELEEANKNIQEWASKLGNANVELEEANVELESKIEEQQRAEDKILEQARLLDEAQDAIGLRDLNHCLIYWNKGAERLYGWTAQEITGKNADKLLYKEESQNLIEAKKKVIEVGEWKGELSQIAKDGKEIIVESRWTLMRDDMGKPKSILIINTDITEEKRVEAQFLRAQRMESIGTLAGGIAHDLNNMLTPIMISLQLLKQKYKDEQSQKLLTILDNNTKRAADLIKQVLSFARGIEGERTLLQVKHIITEIERIANETFPRNIKIRTDIQKALPAISGDATQLHQVIMNLCVNARDAIADGGTLKISAKNFFVNSDYARMRVGAKVGPYVVIAVSDTGIGIPPEIQDRIFEPFFTTKELGKGTGLGLSTALAIVKSHGGFIEVNSEMGKGSVFRVYLPAAITEMQKIKGEKLESHAGNGELVLVAEDEESVREVTISTLENHGYNVLAANDGSEAVELYTRNKDEINIVLMDMMMPVMDGEVSIQAIHQINPGVKVIVVSGLAEKDKLAKIKSTHAQAILPKPYTAEKLLKTIHDVLNAA